MPKTNCMAFIPKLVDQNCKKYVILHCLVVRINTPGARVFTIMAQDLRQNNAFFSTRHLFKIQKLLLVRFRETCSRSLQVSKRWTIQTETSPPWKQKFIVQNSWNFGLIFFSSSSSSSSSSISPKAINFVTVFFCAPLLPWFFVAHPLKQGISGKDI